MFCTNVYIRCLTTGICRQTFFFKLLEKTHYSTNSPRRALMYVPGDEIKKINKAMTLDVDCIALDCEDGVALNKKVIARETIRSFLDQGKPPKKRPYDLGVRINSLDTNYWKDDLKSALSGTHIPDTIMIPKVQSSEDIKMFSDEARKNLKANNSINLVVFIETAIAFVNLIDIGKSMEDMTKNGIIIPVALVFGSDDFCANIDLEGLRKQCEQGMRMGYTGKQVIHPGQVPVVQDAFLPSDNQIKWASELLKSFEKHQKEGKGAFTFKGSMIDMPTMKQAENIVNLSKLKQNEA